MQPPWHYNRQYANKSVYWKSTDSLTIFKENLSIPEHLQYLKDHGWATDLHAISYTFNSHGFRTGEFNNELSAIALGCSFTEGIGLPINQIWPTLLSEKIKLPIWNMGVAGLSLDGCFRLFEYYTSKLNINYVFLLLPGSGRFELHQNNNIQTFIPMVEHHQDKALQNVKKLWMSNENNSYLNKKKNLLSMLKIAEHRNIKLFVKELADFHIDGSRARDMLHDGYESHINLVNLFHNDFTLGASINIHNLLDK